MMRGRKPKPENVIPFRGEGPAVGSEAYQLAIRQRVNQLRPRWMTDAQLRREWRRVATILAQPIVDRLRPHFVDVIAEYCRLCVRLQQHYAAFPTLEAEYYDPQRTSGDPRPQVSFGTSGHRGSSMNGTFTEAHILDITQAN